MRLSIYVFIKIVSMLKSKLDPSLGSLTKDMLGFLLELSRSRFCQGDVLSKNVQPRDGAHLFIILSFDRWYLIWSSIVRKAISGTSLIYFEEVLSSLILCFFDRITRVCEGVYSMDFILCLFPFARRSFISHDGRQAYDIMLCESDLSFDLNGCLRNLCRFAYTVAVEMLSLEAFFFRFTSSLVI